MTEKIYLTKEQERKIIEKQIKLFTNRGGKITNLSPSFTDVKPRKPVYAKDTIQPKND